VAAHPLIARQAVAQHQDATQLIVAVQQNELQVVPQLQPDVRALSALIQSDQVAMKIDRVGMKTVQSVPGQANDLKQVMIADQQADQVQADHQVAAQVQADHQVAAQVLIVRTQIVHAAMMIVRNVLVTKNQNVVNGQANDLKQVMIDDQQVDQVHVRQAVVHQLADQHQIVRIPIVHAAMMIVHAPTVLIQIVRDVMMIDHVVMIVQVVLVGIVRVSHGMIVAVMTVLAMIAHVVVVLIALVVGLLVKKMSVQHVTFLKSELTLMTRSSLITSPVKNYRAQCEMNFVHCQMA
jgi:hypothetical protein